MRFLKPIEPDDTDILPTRRRIEAIMRIAKSFPIGARIRYHPEFDTASLLDTLVLGYVFDDYFVFTANQFGFSGSESIPTIDITEYSRADAAINLLSLNRIDSFQLLIPSSAGEERKLDCNSRASLGRNGPFAKGSPLTLITLGGAENLRMNVVVHKRMLLPNGPHQGMQVAVLDVLLESLEGHEPRAQPRVETRMPATVCRDGSDKVLPAFILDVSEFYMRLMLDHSESGWPPLSAKHFVLISLKPWPDRPVLKLHCHFVREAGGERVFEIVQVLKQDKFIPFEMLDAIELKIALMS